MNSPQSKKDQVSVSVIMPTFNSAKTIEKSLASVRSQDYPQELIEIILADGGSTDETLKIAERHSCLVVKNERLQPECGKQVGLQTAKGKYAVFLDSDEQLLRMDTFSKKVKFLENNPTKARNFVTAGLLNPPGYAAINDYTNRYGDPFSAYMYGIDGGDYFPSLKSRYQIAHDREDVLVVEFKPQDFLPIVDGGGHFFDREFLLSISDINDLSVIPNVFNLMVARTNQLGVLKDDYIHHYSTVSLSKYVQKIRWRIVSNLFHADKVGAGFQGKQQFQPVWFKIKKYLFIPYGLTLVLPVLKSLILALRRKNAVYLLHGPLSFLTAAMITYFTVLKATGGRAELSAYGKK